MESRGTEQIALSPTITMAKAPFDRPIETSAIIINNTSKHPLVIDQIVMAANNEDIQSVHHRSERDTAGTLGCTFIPALAIYNYVTHSRCNQGDELWHKVKQWFSDENKDKVVLVAGDSSLLKPQPHSPDNSRAVLTLTQIQTQLHNQALTLPATAQFCKTSMENILAARYPRDTNMHCSLWVSRILADFTLLFGDSMRDWTIDVLRRVLQQIYENDTTGYAASDPAAESRLVNEVREVIRNLGQDEAIRQISQAFEYTRLNYARYLTHNPTTAAATPAAAQRLPLGTYSLSLASYHYPTDRPAVRVRENGEWVTHPDLYFDIDILDTTIPGQPGIDGPLMDDARAALTAWSDIYHAVPVHYYATTNEFWSESDRTLDAGRSNSYFLYSELLAPEEDYVYVAVRLQGDIVSILAARRDESFENSHENYRIAFFVTDPNYVLEPDNEGSVRGAGSAALHGLAHYLQQHGVKMIRSRVISQPAARVSTKLGFHHDEF
ncbi:GNAT family N-acetyltransferase [Yersinia aldovae]|uniref:GNAT family N-acetyltransferase n=1 Tax=Yersinia aldovae TaxID=29483 RepID=UPI0021BD7171|nr:GNAT family N-acetyltransferase [Yersinia aldovae]